MKGFGGVSLLVAFLLMWHSLASAKNSSPFSGPLGDLRTQETPTPAIPPPVFVPDVIVTSLGDPAPGLQDVEGAVVDAAGNAIIGLRIRVASDGWEAYDTTKGGGTFKFTLSKGMFSMRVADRESSPAFFVLDGNTRVRVVFREVRSQPAPLTTPRSPFDTTPRPTQTPGTPLPTATDTATKTPEIEVGTPVVVRPAAPAAPTAIIPRPKRSTPLLPTLSFAPWTGAFLVGLGLGVLVFLIGLVLALLRRQSSQ